MSFPNPPPQPTSQSFSQRSFFEGDVSGFWPHHPTNHPNFPFNVENHEFPAQFDNGPPFKRPRNSENYPSTNFAQLPPSSAPKMNSSGNKGTSHIFYKTRLCVKFHEGNCKNGEHCTFAHGQQDLREPPPNWQELVREKDKDGVPGNWNDDHRLVHKMKFCKKFYNGEECPYGEKCNFLHERPNPCFREDHTRFRTEVTRERENPAISIPPRGPAIGTRGPAVGTLTEADPLENNLPMGSKMDAMRSKPVYWKTKLCSKWEITGQCPFGERCHFAHGHSGILRVRSVSGPLIRFYTALLFLDWLASLLLF